MSFRSLFIVCALALSPCVALGAPAPVATPIEHFFENPAFSKALLSPDARNLAVRNSTGGGRALLAVVELATMQIKVVAHFADADVGRFDWVNNERLVFNTTDAEAGQGEERFRPGLSWADDCMTK